VGGHDLNVSGSIFLYPLGVVGCALPRGIHFFELQFCNERMNNTDYVSIGQLFCLRSTDIYRSACGYFLLFKACFFDTAVLFRKVLSGKKSNFNMGSPSRGTAKTNLGKKKKVRYYGFCKYCGQALGQSMIEHLFGYAILLVKPF
jgi:hypothetical protein